MGGLLAGILQGQRGFGDEAPAFKFQRTHGMNAGMGGMVWVHGGQRRAEVVPEIRARAGEVGSGAGNIRLICVL